jgi:Tetracyclin repressor-like, C-terminal domain
MVVDAVRERDDPTIAMHTSGTLRGDLIELVQGVARAFRRDGDLAITLLAAARRDDDLLRALRERLRDPLREACRHAMQLAIEREEIAATADVTIIDEIALPVLLHRVLWREPALDDASINNLVDTILLPLVGLTG